MRTSGPNEDLLYDSFRFSMSLLHTIKEIEEAIEIRSTDDGQYSIYYTDIAGNKIRLLNQADLDYMLEHRGSKGESVKDAIVLDVEY